jgi:hypothetical protein
MKHLTQILVGIIFLSVVACGSDVHPEQAPRTEITQVQKADFKFLNLEELNQKLAGLSDEDAFDIQVQASIQKLEKKDLFLVRVLKENNYKMLSFGEIFELKSLEVCPENGRFGCQDDKGNDCLYELVRRNDWIRIKRMSVLLKDKK